MLAVLFDVSSGAEFDRTFVQKAGGRAVTTKVELQGSDGGGWQSMNNVWGASWEMSSTPKPPLNIRVTDDHGNTVRHSAPPSFNTSNFCLGFKMQCNKSPELVHSSRTCTNTQTMLCVLTISGVDTYCFIITNH